MRADASSPEVKIKRYTPKRIVTEHHFKANGFSYTWTRTVSLSERAVTVHDRVRATSTAKVSQFWHLSPVNAVLSRDGRSAVLQLRGGDAVVDQASGHGGGAFKLSHRPAIDPENRVCVANRLASSARGRQVEMKVRFKLPK